MAIWEDADAGDVGILMSTRPMLTILFIDESELCKKYIAAPWVAEEAEVISAYEDVAEIFQIGKVPQYRFFLDGNEIANLVGTQNREAVMEMKEQVFGNLRLFKPRG